MRIAILGATGLVGRSLAVDLLRGRLLDPEDRLVLGGHDTRSTEMKLLAERIDLLDAFDDERVGIDVIGSFDEIEADFVLVAAGATVSAECPTRRDLARVNRPLFEQIGCRLAARLPEALYIVVSNPVELAVQILSEAAGRQRIVGMGAQQDSLRFARAIAQDLRISRHEVRATVLGEHGNSMIPLWSTVEILRDERALSAGLRDLQGRANAESMQTRVERLRQEVSEHLREERVAEAYRAAADALPDARIFVEPFITAHCQHSTPQATANATLGLLAAMLANDGRRVHGQVALDREAFGVSGVFGVPLSVGMHGWRIGALPELARSEEMLVRQSSEQISAFLASARAETG